MINPLQVHELQELLSTGSNAALSQLMTETHPATIAESSEDLTVDQTWQLLNRAPIEIQAAVFALYSPSKQVELVAAIEPGRMPRLLEAMSHDDRVDLLQRMDHDVVERLLPLITQVDREDIRELLSYPEHSAGSVMTTDYTSVPADVTVGEALELLRQQAASAETVYYVYVLDEQRHLLGILSLRRLIVANPTERVREIMQRDVISARVDDDREHVAQQLAKYDFLAIPVVDDLNRLVGIVTYDDAIDVVTQEATEDVLRMGGVATIEANYLEAPFSAVWKRRTVWLSVLFVAELFTFTALAHFEDAIQAVIALSLFVPLCISTGGNSGSQAATLVTRALALGQVHVSDWWPVLRRELMMGMALGATLGLIGFVRAALTPASVLGNADRWMLALTISQAVTAICLWGTLVGSMLPLIFKKLHFDPGYASSPFVATFVDVTGIVIYFTIAKLCLL